jgi:hypothetical protein
MIVVSEKRIEGKVSTLVTRTDQELSEMLTMTMFAFRTEDGSSTFLLPEVDNLNCLSFFYILKVKAFRDLPLPTFLMSSQSVLS